MHFRLCQAIRRVLLSGSCPGHRSQRAIERLRAIRAEVPWLEGEGNTVIVRDAEEGLRWWTFGGLVVNTALAEWLRRPTANPPLRRDNLWIELEADADRDELEARLTEARQEDQASLWGIVDERALDGLKFGVCVPPAVAHRMLADRLADRSGLEVVLSQEIRWVSTAPA